MKTKFFLLIGLIFLLSAGKMSAQWPPIIPDDTRTVVWTFTADWDEIVTCDGQDISIHVDLTFRENDLFQNGEAVRGINHVVDGGGINLLTGETFKVNMHIKGYAPANEEGNYENGMYKFTMVGDQGSRYIASFTFLDHDPYFTIDKMVCPSENKKK